jgi:hypothetical protein
MSYGTSYARSHGPTGIWRDNGVLVIDPRQAIPGTFPKRCIFTNDPVKGLRTMTLQEVDVKTAGGVIRTQVARSSMDLPISDGWYAERVKKTQTFRAWLFVTTVVLAVLCVVTGLCAGQFPEWPNVAMVACSLGAFAFISLVVALAFPYMTDVVSDPKVISCYYWDGKFMIKSAHPLFLIDLPEVPPQRPGNWLAR